MLRGLRSGLPWVLAIATNLPAEVPVVPRADFGMPLEVAGKVIHGAGQGKLTEFAGLAAALPEACRPAFMMVYLGVNQDPAGAAERFARWRDWLAMLPPGVGLQIGLSFTKDGEGRKAQYAEAVAAGDYDERLRAFAAFIREIDRPVWVRIGYECNGFWNGYEPASYRAAFRHIARLLREQAGEKVATVWCVHPIDPLPRLMEFYPGDEWVDWWSIDLFQPKFLHRPVVTEFCQEALAHRRPVLIGEATPAEVPVAEQAEKWFAPFFALIRSQPAIKGFSYINRNWNGSRWDWGDARLHVAPDRVSAYAREMGRPLYHHAPGEWPAEFAFAPISLPPEASHLRAGRTLRVPLPPQNGARMRQVALAYRLVDAAGVPVREGQAKLIIRDDGTGEVLAEINARARVHADQIAVDLPGTAPVKTLRLTVEGDPALAVALSREGTPDGLDPFLFLVRPRGN